MTPIMRFLGLALIISGTLAAARPDLMIRFYLWQNKTFLGAKVTPDRKKSTRFYRITGGITLALGLVLLYVYF